MPTTITVPLWLALANSALWFISIVCWAIVILT